MDDRDNGEKDEKGEKGEREASLGKDGQPDVETPQAAPYRGNVVPLFGDREPSVQDNDAAYEEEDGAFDEDEDDYEPPPRRKWIARTIVALLAAALVGNILAFWPQIYNRETLPFLFKSRELSSREEVQDYKEAVVLVSTDKGKGTGFHLTGGYIVTNYHVIDGGDFTAVKFPAGDRQYAADVAASDSKLDIAILKADIGGEALPSIGLEREQPWKSGDHVYVIGNPLYFSQIVSEGSVMGTVPVAGRNRPVLAVDAPVYKGNSGSPVINAYGKAIAVIYAIGDVVHEGRTVQAGLAVPIEDLFAMLPELKNLKES